MASLVGKPCLFFQNFFVNLYGCIALLLAISFLAQEIFSLIAFFFPGLLTHVSTNVLRTSRYCNSFLTLFLLLFWCIYFNRWLMKFTVYDSDTRNLNWTWVKIVALTAVFQNIGRCVDWLFIFSFLVFILLLDTLILLWTNWPSNTRFWMTQILWGVKWVFLFSLVPLAFEPLIFYEVSIGTVIWDFVKWSASCQLISVLIHHTSKGVNGIVLFPVLGKPTAEKALFLNLSLPAPAASPACNIDSLCFKYYENVYA